MKRYAIYDLKTGHILQTYSEVDRSGRHKQLSEEDVVATLYPSVGRDKVGVALIEFQPIVGQPSGFKIDLATRELAAPAPKKS